MADNRFTDISKNLTELSSPSVKSKRSAINLCASVERDARVVSTNEAGVDKTADILADKINAQPA